MHWLESPKLCRIDIIRLDILVLFLIFEGKMFSYYMCWFVCLLVGFFRIFVDALYRLGKFLFMPSLLRVFMKNGCDTFSNALLCLLR